MIQIERGKPLKELTTFKTGGPAAAYAKVSSENELQEAFDAARSVSLEPFILGGGSNLLVSDRGLQQFVIDIAFKGIEIREGDQLNTKLLEVAAGEVWDDVVRFAVELNLWGIENLSRIPGKAGAVPVQNVGAYGPEAKDVVVNVTVFDRRDNSVKTLSNEECGFSYRKSIFNTTEKGRYVILSSLFRLSTDPHPRLDYPDVKRRFENNPNPSIGDIRQAIIEIRDNKFPFPPESVEGNAGSFFKNSVLTEEQYISLEARFADNLPRHLERLQQIRHKFPYADGIKIPSAFILEVCELRGFGHGNVQLNPTQPVVVLNKTGNASSSEVLTLVKEVRSIVELKTGLHLYTEPELIGFTSDELRSFGFIDEEIDRYVDGVIN
jgi:UDP-N-acetylmuramate dehydrogenase